MKSVKIVNVLLIAAALPILAGAATRRYLVELSTEPAARFASRNFGERKESLARPEVQAYRTRIRSEQDGVAANIRALGGVLRSRTDTASNTITVDLPEEKAASLASIAGVRGYHPVRLYRKKLDQASIVHNFPQVYGQVGGISNAGAGIKIAMIDTGIDITQPAFSDAGFQAPAGFPKVNTTTDTQFTNNKVIVARSYYQLWANPDSDDSASDESGHGTSTADCAAGGPTVGSLATFFGQTNLVSSTFTGAAPGAYLGSYKVFGTPGQNDGATDTAILQAIDDAVNDGMDIINYSLGSFPPVPAALDDVAQAMQTAVAGGVIVAAAAGNDGDGDDPSNFIDWISADGQATTVPALVSSEGAASVIQVGASSNQRAFGSMLTVGTSKFLVDPEYSITTDNNNNYLLFSGAPIIDVTTLDKTGQACNTLPARSLSGAIALISLAGYDPNADTCDPDQKLDNALAAGAVAGIIYDDFPESFYDISNIYSGFYGVELLDSTNLPGGFITYEDGIALLNQISGQSGATATLDFSVNPVPLNPSRVSFSSSRGPNADLEIKPDLVAVGQDLLTAAETINPGGDFFDPSGAGLLYPANGTSASTPLVSGMAAILKAAHPGLSVSDYRSMIINSAAPIGDPINGGFARVMDTGAGLLDANAALNAEATIVPASLSFGIGATLRQSVTVKNVGTAQDTFALSVTPHDSGFPTPQLDQSSLTLAPGATATVNVSMPSGLQSGEYEGSIQIQGSNTATKTHVMYWLGVPGSPYLITDMGFDLSSFFNRGQLNTAAIAFRVTDNSGIYLTNILNQVTITYNGTYNANTNAKVNGNQQTSAPYYLTDTTSPFYLGPGVIAVDVTTSSARNVYDSYTVTIGNPNTSTLALDFFIFGQ